MATPDQKYTLTPEHFARARADLDRRRAQLNDSHEAAVAAVAGHGTAMALLDDELAKLEADERTAAEIAKRYSGAADAHPPSAPPSRARRSNFGRPYTRKEDARIKAAARGELEQLAQDLERPYSGVLKRHENSPQQSCEDRDTRADPDEDRRRRRQQVRGEPADVHTARDSPSRGGAGPGAGAAGFRKSADCCSCCRCARSRRDRRPAAHPHAARETRHSGHRSYRRRTPGEAGS